MEYKSKYTGAEVDALLDKIAEDNVGDIDSALSTESENPVTNKAITEELNKKLNTTDLATINGQRIDEGGDIVIEGGGEPYDDTELKEAISKKADKDGIYPDMSVGQSANLLGVSDGESGEFLFRATDGDGSIKDGIASIAKIEGNSVVWNQKFAGGLVGNSASVENTDNGTVITAQSATFINAYIPFAYIPNHKYLYSAIATLAHADMVVMGTETTGNAQYRQEVSMANTPTAIEGIVSCVSTATTFYIFPNWNTAASVGDSFTFKDIRIIDLTQMFGAGNEPTTIEEFNARKPKVEDEYAYNEGEVINMCADSIKTVGFNAWDEEWEEGRYSTSTGLPENISIFIRCKNPIRVLPNTQYYIALPQSNLWIAFLEYDSEGKFLRNRGGVVKAITTSVDCEYVRFFVSSNYSTTYNHDICINLAHTGYRNGEYEPYVSNEKALPIADYFPNGMNAIGDVKDELTPTEAIQRIGVVDMGSLDWKDLSAGMFYINKNEVIALNMKSYDSNDDPITNLLSSRHQSTNTFDISNIDKIIRGPFETAYGGYLTIKDTAYTDAASFKAAMAGVMLYYELAEPIVTKIDTPLDLTYPAWDFGTEEIIADTPTTPFRGSIIYEFNARDTIRANKKAIEGMAIEDYADGKLKVSINGVSKDFMAATPSGDPMHYMYVTAGAEYNDTGADITRTGVYWDTIVWKAGYWWLNELGDITNEEMREIYACRYPIRDPEKLLSWWRGTKQRTILSTANGASSAHPELRAYFNSTIKTIYHQNTAKDRGILLDIASSMCRDCSGLTKVLQYIDCQYITQANNMDRPFIGCSALKEVRIKNLKFAISFQDSLLLSNASILYMIENEAATSATVITLHADAYARAMADEAITTALAAHPNVSLASA